MNESQTVHHDQQTFRRGRQAAIAGLSVQFVLAVFITLLTLWSESPALGVLTWYLFGGLGIWLTLVILYNQHTQERIETLENERLARTDAAAAALFDEHADDLELAKRRLDRLYRWGLPITSIISATYLLVVGFVLVMSNYAMLAEGVLAADVMRPGADPLLGVFLVAGSAFVAFIVARYVAGMTDVRDWSLLRGGASYLMGNCVVGVLVVLGLVVMSFGNEPNAGLLDGSLSSGGNSHFAMAIIAIVVPGLMILIGCETLLTLLFDLYRPRKPGEVSRPAFDSRVLGILTAPQSIGKIIGETLNYQFGFELSKSWFYLLLGRAITPLIVVGGVVLLAASSVVIVGPAEEMVLTRFGVRTAIVGPGPHLKWFWPIGGAERYDVGRVQRVMIGSSKSLESLDVAILWTNQHTEGKEGFMIVLPSRLGDADARASVSENVRVGGGISEGGISVGGISEGSVTDDDRAGNPDFASERAGVSLLSIEGVVLYRIANLEKYIEAAADAESVLAAYADGVLNDYCATHDVDHLLASGRVAAEKVMRDKLQPFAETLGLEVLFTGITIVHPPTGEEAAVAAAFHKQIGALQEKEGAIEEAQTLAITILGGVAGSEAAALELEEAIITLDRLRDAGPASVSDADNEAHRRLVIKRELEIERLLAKANGLAANVVFDARADQWRQAVGERGKAERFKAELAAYRASPQYFSTEMYLDTLSEAIAESRKTVLMTDKIDASTLRIDLKDSQSALDFLNVEP